MQRLLRLRCISAQVCRFRPVPISRAGHTAPRYRHGRATQMDHANFLTTDGPVAKRRAPLWIIMFASIIAALTPRISFAHGVVGNRIFLSPIVGNDAFPDNALNLAVRRSDYEFSLISALEKQLSDNSSLLFVSSWQRVTPGVSRRREEGFGDLQFTIARVSSSRFRTKWSLP